MALTVDVGFADGAASPADAPVAHRRGPFRPARLTPVRERLSGPMLARRFRLIDFAVVWAAVLIGAALAAEGRLLDQPFGRIAPLLAAAPVMLASLGALRAYALGPRETLKRHLSRIIGGVGAGVVAALAVSLVTSTGLAAIAPFVLLALVGLAGSHALAWSTVRRWRAAGRLTPNIVVVGATENAARLIESALQSREANVLGIFDDRAARSPVDIQGVPVLGDTATLLEHKILPCVDRIVITVTSSAQARVRALIQRLRVLPNAVTLFVDVEGEDTRAATLSRLADAPLTQVSGVQEDERRAFNKRMQDLVMASVALVILAPALALIALAVKLESPGPVFFRQRRHGFNNEAILVWKFRSMRQEATDHTAVRQVSANDDRVTRVGRFIRKTSLDELPQLINVIRGEMSLVGPRPHPIGMLTAGQDTTQLVWDYAWRHRMRPGLTGWAQINGSRGPVASAEDVRRRVALDVDYIERQSFLFDLYIMAMTLPCLLGDRQAVR